MTSGKRMWDLIHKEKRANTLKPEGLHLNILANILLKLTKSTNNMTIVFTKHTMECVDE